MTNDTPTPLATAVEAYERAVAAERSAEAAFGAASAAASAQCGGEFWADCGGAVMWNPDNAEKFAEDYISEDFAIVNTRCPARVRDAAEAHRLAALFDLSEETRYLSYDAEKALLAMPCNSRAEQLAKFASLAGEENPSDLLRGDLVATAWGAIEAALRSGDDDADKAAPRLALAVG